MKKNQDQKNQRQLRISIKHQSLELLEDQHGVEHVLVSYRISSSKYGLGTEPGSYKTPLGKFLIKEKIGDGAPSRMIFQARQPTGILAALGGEEDYVLTRILWLSGLDLDNANTLERYIYIHGTNQEDLIGSPASHGCIRLNNHDIIELFERVQEGDRVEIIV